MECTEMIQKTLENMRLGFRCSPSDKRVSIVTPYLYPDNDLVEVFVEETSFNQVRVTDLGETLRHLESLGVDVLASSKRRFLLEQITQRLHINIQRGKLEKEGPAEELGALLMDVVSAAHGVADLIYTSKAYEPATFPEEVSMFLNEHQVKHEKNVAVLGTTGKKYRVDIRVDGSIPREILIETMSPPQEGAMTATINRVFRMWFDVDAARRKISLLNDVDYTWRAEDTALLGNVCTIQRWTDKERLLDYVRTETSS